MGESGPTAADIVNVLPEGELAAIIGRLGEERRARAIAKAIVARRAEQPITTTSELADIVASVLGRKREEKKHPATRTFQALRLYLNQELDELARGGRTARRGHLPFARGPHRQALFRQPQRSAAPRLPAFARGAL
jgi:16S rRNA (cytosine1402-N4)-methyltransferase